MEFKKKGSKFTMDDVASDLHMSKKTIYKEFDDKDELFYATVDYGFTNVYNTVDCQFTTRLTTPISQGSGGTTICR